MTALPLAVLALSWAVVLAAILRHDPKPGTNGETVLQRSAATLIILTLLTVAAVMLDLYRTG